MFQQIGAALQKSSTRRTHEPVRRNSHRADKAHGSYWRSTDRQSVRQIVLAAERYEITMKQRGSRNGPLGHVAIEVLKYFANIVDFRTGRLEPSIDTLMAKLRRSRGAIVTALKALRAHGFLDWLRRYIPTNNPGAGPQVKQTSNAYRMSLPARAKALLGKYGTKPPIPDDMAQERQEREDAIKSHLNALSLPERALEVIENTKLGQALARLGKNLEKKRESTKETESGPRSIILMEEEADAAVSGR